MRMKLWTLLSIVCEVRPWACDGRSTGMLISAFVFEAVGGGAAHHPSHVCPHNLLVAIGHIWWCKEAHVISQLSSATQIGGAFTNQNVMFSKQ